MTGSAVIVSLRVQATPQHAFDVFTQEIALWWRPERFFQLTPRGDGTLRFEPGENGRLVTDLPNGKTFEIGRITAWRPGEKLGFSWRQATFAPDQLTHVTVTFEPAGDGETRVTVEHRGWESVPPITSPSTVSPSAFFSPGKASIGGCYWPPSRRGSAPNSAPAMFPTRPGA